MEISVNALPKTLADMPWKVEFSKSEMLATTIGEPVDCVIVGLEESDYDEAPQIKQKQRG